MALHSAAREGDAGRIQALLAAGGDIDEKNSRGFTALHVVAMSGNCGSAEILLDYGASLSVQTNTGATPLHVAVIGDMDGSHIALIKVLLDFGADPAAKNEDDETPADLCCNADISALFANPPPVSRHPKAKSEPAAAEPEQEQEQEAAAPALSQDELNKALQDATKNNNTDAAANALDAGADLSAKNKAGMTALHLAAFKGLVSMGELLLTRGADIEAASNDGSTALHVAVIADHAPFVHMLVGRGANKNAKNESDSTPLDCAVDDDIIAILSEDAAAGGGEPAAVAETELEQPEPAAEPEQPEPEPVAAAPAAAPAPAGPSEDDLFAAVQKGDTARVSACLAAGISANCRNTKRNFSPMHSAACSGHVSVGKLLLAAGSDVDATQNTGSTPLHLAVLFDRFDFVKFLLESGANKDLKNADGEDPSVACSEPKIKELLLLSKATPVSKPVTVAKPVVTVAKPAVAPAAAKAAPGPSAPVTRATTTAPATTAAPAAESMGVLDDDEEDEEVPNNSNSTPEKEKALFVAIRQKKNSDLQKLIAEGVDVNAKEASKKNRTALMAAASMGASSACKILIDAGCSLNVKNEDGYTALHFATVMDEVEVVKLLVAEGADANIKHDGAETPADMALNDTIKKALLQRTRTVSGRDKQGKPTVILDEPEGSWFRKAGGGKSGFGAARRRYFLMQGNEIKYFKNFKNSKPTEQKGTLVITKDIKVSHQGTAIHITEPTRKWLLEAEDADQAEYWATKIEKAAKQLESSC